MAIICFLFGNLMGGAIFDQFLKLRPFFKIFLKNKFFSYEMALHETPRTVEIFDLPALVFEKWAFKKGRMEVGHPVSSNL